MSVRTMVRSIIIIASSCWLIGARPLAAQAQPAVRPMPNIVLIVADDLGIGDLQTFGGKVGTPNLDRLVSQGMSFTDAHTNSVICHPPRFGIATGSDPYRTGSRYGFSRAIGNGLRGGGRVHKTLGDILQGVRDEQNNPVYATSFMGKMHLGLPKFREHGYDHAYGLPTGIQAEENLIIDSNAELITDDSGDPLSDGIFGLREAESVSLIGGRLANAARQFIESQSHRPFFLHYNSQAVHGPYFPPDTFTNHDGSQTPVKGSPDVTPSGRPLSDPAAMIRELDLQVGMILDTLRAEGVEENTLIMFTSDNGAVLSLQHMQPMMPEGHRSSGTIVDADGVHHDIRGTKGTAWEGGHRVPFIVKWGDGTEAGSIVKPGTTNDQLVSTNDFMASFYDLTGQAMEEKQAMDSASFLPTLLDPERAVRDRMMVLGHGLPAVPDGNIAAAWRMDDEEGEWVLLLESTEANRLRVPRSEELLGAELYNLTLDPSQTNNLIETKIRFDADETPNADDLLAILDEGLRSRVATMIDDFFGIWETNDPRTMPAVDYSIAANQTPIPSLQPLHGDTNGDGVVDVADLNNVRNNFGAAGESVIGDTWPFDGVVDLGDLNAVRNNFGAGMASAQVPEPASWLLAVMGLLLAGVAVRRRRD